MKPIKLFPTVIAEHDLRDDPDLPLMLSIIENLDFKPHPLVANALSTFAVDDGRWLHKPLLSNFRVRLQAIIDQYVSILGVEPVMLANSWVNKLRPGSYIKQHRHEMSVISGALYIYADPGSVPLSFYNPTAPLRMFEYAVNTNDLNSGMFTVGCETGKLLLFPSWLEHSSDLNTTENRITLSFNTTYLPKKN
jgi:uncharacterized protein (TIGR02466 family)